MNKVKIIALVGMPGSGKGTCVEYLSEKYDWPLVYFGGMVYEEVHRRGLDIVKDEKFVREDMRKLDGPAVLAKRAAVKAEELIAQGHPVILFDGLYSWSEYKFLEEKFGENLVVIAVAAPRKLRHQRLLNRKDSRRKYTLDQIIARDRAEIENLEKGGPIAYADYTIANDHGLSELLNKIDDILTIIQET